MNYEWWKVTDSFKLIFFVLIFAVAKRMSKERALLENDKLCLKKSNFKGKLK